jgi:phosphotransferase system  glucose/maltose/N-acetylglucosamine-specific IIC component
LYDRYGHLAAAVLVHFGANLLSVILQYANVSYPALWVYIVVMVAAIIVSVAIYRFLIKKREDN